MRYKIKLIGSKTTAPVSGARLVFADPSGNIIADLQADADGVLVLDSEFDADLLQSGNEMRIVAPGYVPAFLSTDMVLPETTLSLIEKTDVVAPLVLGIGLGLVGFWFSKKFRNG